MLMFFMFFTIFVVAFAFIVVVSEAFQHIAIGFYIAW
jgi:hypothetical protein